MTTGDGDYPTPEELEAHFGEAGPVAAARSWLEAALVRGDLAAAWPATDPTLRLVLVQAWAWANRRHPDVGGRYRDLDALAAALAGEAPDHPAWFGFAEAQVAELRRVRGEWDPATWGAGSQPRPVAPDLELVVFSEVDPAGGARWVTEPTLVHAHLALMRSTPAGWLLASFADVLPTPGWPPGWASEGH